MFWVFFFFFVIFLFWFFFFSCFCFFFNKCSLKKTLRDCGLSANCTIKPTPFRTQHGWKSLSLWWATSQSPGSREETKMIYFFKYLCASLHKACLQALLPWLSWAAVQQTLIKLLVKLHLVGCSCALVSLLLDSQSSRQFLRVSVYIWCTLVPGSGSFLQRVSCCQK